MIVNKFGFPKKTSWFQEVKCKGPLGCGAELSIDQFDIYREIKETQNHLMMRYMTMCPCCGNGIALDHQEVPPFEFPDKTQWLSKRKKHLIESLYSLTETDKEKEDLESWLSKNQIEK